MQMKLLKFLCVWLVQQFKNGQGLVEDKVCIGRPASSINNGQKFEQF
jgi:hypothetical protein